MATTWGTFLHAAVPVHVLLIIVGAGGARRRRSPGLARRMGWTRPVAWLGALLAVGGSALFSVALLPGVAAPARPTRRGRTRCWRSRWPPIGRAARRLGARDHTTSPSGWPRPQRVPALALPDESPADVAGPRPPLRRAAGWSSTSAGARRLARRSSTSGDPAPACFHEIPLPVPVRPGGRRRRSQDVRVFADRLPVGADVARSAPRPLGAARRSPWPRRRITLAARWTIPGANRRGTRFDELHAEAAEALAYAANTLRAVRDRYRGGLPRRPGPLAGPRRTTSTSLEQRAATARERHAPADGRRTHSPPRPPRRAPPTCGCGSCAARWTAPAATWPATRRSCPAWSSPSATSRAPGCSWSAATPRLVTDPALPGLTTELQMRIVEAQEAERAGWPRRSTTARRRRSPTRSSRSSSSTASSSPTRAWPARSCGFLRELLRRELGDVRSFIVQLRPPVLDELGLDGVDPDAVDDAGRAVRPADQHRPRRRPRTA